MDLCLEEQRWHEDFQPVSWFQGSRYAGECGYPSLGVMDPACCGEERGPGAEMTRLDSHACRMGYVQVSGELDGCQAWVFGHSTPSEPQREEHDQII